MNRNNNNNTIYTALVAIALMALIVGFTTHLITPNVLKAVALFAQQQKGTFLPTIEKKGTEQAQFYRVAQFEIDKSQFKKICSNYRIY